MIGGWKKLYLFVNCSGSRLLLSLPQGSLSSLPWQPLAIEAQATTDTHTAFQEVTVFRKLTQGEICRQQEKKTEDIIEKLATYRIFSGSTSARPNNSFGQSTMAIDWSQSKPGVYGWFCKCFFTPREARKHKLGWREWRESEGSSINPAHRRVGVFLLAQPTFRSGD